MLPTKDDEKSLKNSCNLACCAAVWLSLAPLLARIVRSTSQKMKFQQNLQGKKFWRRFSSHLDAMEIHQLQPALPPEEQSLAQDVEEMSENLMWFPFKNISKNTSKNLCSLLFWDSFVWLFFVVIVCFGAFQISVLETAFLLGSFPPGLCGGSTTANSYSKSRSEPKNSDKSEGRVFLRDVPMIS